MTNLMIKSGVVKSLSINDQEMNLINKMTLDPLSAEDVYTFEVVACDNDIDRDFERISDESLEKMAQLIVGKTVIKNHKRDVDNQFARIYAAYVEQSGSLTSDGLPKKQLIVKCFTLADEANSQIISEIKGGIKKEVSISFMPNVVTCSICGTDQRAGCCGHMWGEVYDGRLCFFELSDVTDVYELSFVAVPAQRGAGVRKDYEIEKLPKKETPKTIDFRTKQIALADAYLAMHMKG